MASTWKQAAIAVEIVGTGCCNRDANWESPSNHSEKVKGKVGKMSKMLNSFQWKGNVERESSQKIKKIKLFNLMTSNLKIVFLPFNCYFF